MQELQFKFRNNSYKVNVDPQKYYNFDSIKNNPNKALQQSLALAIQSIGGSMMLYGPSSLLTSILNVDFVTGAGITISALSVIFMLTNNQEQTDYICQSYDSCKFSADFLTTIISNKLGCAEQGQNSHLTGNIELFELCE